MMKKILTVSFLMFCFILNAQSTATYTLTFESNWSNATHPSNNFPANAHWSKLVGATHSDEVVFLNMGDLASTGIENIAEQGNNSQFFTEINNAITNSYANQIIDGDDLPSPLGSIIINNVMTTEAYPLLTLVSMIAPSPDWMIAINSISLIDGNNEWIDEIIIDLYPYDAGTDNGTDYNAPNEDTNPQEPITSLQGIAPFSSEIIGTLTITLENVVLATNDFLVEKNVAIYPNPVVNKTTVSIVNTTISAIEIYTALGNKIADIRSINNSETEVNLTNLSSGIYLFKIIDASGKSTLKKVIKR